MKGAELMPRRRWARRASAIVSALGSLIDVELRQVGRTGLKVSRLGLGTMTWGRDTDEHEARDQLEEFVGAGGTLLDTAASYGDGESERVIGQLLSRVIPRDEVVLASKAGISRRSGRRVVDISRGALLDSLDASLARLGTDHVDLWQVHTWSDDVALEETMTALDYALATGRTRYVGVSNYSGWQCAAAATHQRAHPSRAALSSNQVEYSLVNRGIEADVLPAAEYLGLGILVWSPLGRGVLTGKYRNGTPADSRAASAHFAGFVQPYLSNEARRTVEAVCTAAEGLGVAPLEVALSWVRDRPGVASAIVGARTAAQLRGILPTEEIELPAAIRSALDDVSSGVLLAD